MPKGISDFIYERLKSVIISDKTGAISSKLNIVLEKELSAVLNNYFDLEDVCVDVRYDSDGCPYVQMLGKINNFKRVNIVE